MLYHFLLNWCGKDKNCWCFEDKLYLLRFSSTFSGLGHCVKPKRVTSGGQGGECVGHGLKLLNIV